MTEALLVPADARRNERILDIGCGADQHVAAISGKKAGFRSHQSTGVDC